MERGYVKLWRKAIDSGIVENAHAWQLFGYLLMTATYKEKKFSSNGVIFPLLPGDAIFSRVAVSKKLKMSERNARTALEFLKRMEIVTTKVTNKFTVVSFVNWETYQQERPANRPAECPTGDQQVTNNRPTGDQQVTTALRIEERKKEKESKNPPLTPQGGSEGDRNAISQIPPAKDSDEPDIAFCELREYYDTHFKNEGPKTGFVEFKAFIAKKKYFPYADVYRDLDARERNQFWNPGFAPSLATYIRDEYWRSSSVNKHRQESGGNSAYTKQATIPPWELKKAM